MTEPSLRGFSAGLRRNQIDLAAMPDDLAAVIHAITTDHGFWDGERNFAEMMMLATSELVEAMEEHREGRIGLWYSHDKHCPMWEGGTPYPDPFGDAGQCCVPKPEGAIIEVIDTIIRCLDTAHHLVEVLNEDGDQRGIIEYMRLKMHYNNQREHKHGKRY